MNTELIIILHSIFKLSMLNELFIRNPIYAPLYSRLNARADIRKLYAVMGKIYEPSINPDNFKY